MEIKASRVVRIQIRNAPYTFTEGKGGQGILPDFSKWMLEADVFPVQGTSGGALDFFYGDFSLDDVEKVREWFAGRGIEVTF